MIVVTYDIKQKEKLVIKHKIRVTQLLVKQQIETPEKDGTSMIVI